MERHENAICAYEAQPEVNLTQGLIHQAAGDLGEPEVSTREDPEDCRHGHDHVEVTDNEVGSVQHDVDRRLRQEKAAYAAADKHRNKAQSEQRSRVDAQPGAIQTANP